VDEVDAVGGRVTAEPQGVVVALQVGVEVPAEGLTNL
jgi:hypothetical protein